jgi:exopolysaccharide biosynthesis WecB/TagA/CpsF family protein
MARRVAEMVVGRDPTVSATTQIERARRALSGKSRDLEHPHGRAAALVDRMALVPDQASEDALITRLVRSRETLRVGFVNAHAVNLAWHDPAMARDLLDVDILLRDGIGLERLLRRLGRDPGRNMNGTDLIPKILAAASHRPVAIYGTAEPWLGRAADHIAKGGGRVVDSAHGFLDDEAYVDRFERSDAQIALLAMGMPKQERVSRALTRRSRPGLILCGGAIVDFLAGRQPRAPALVRRAGLEWAFRLMLEPRRLCRRYLVGNVLFCARMSLMPGRAPARIAYAFLGWALGGHRKGLQVGPYLSHKSEMGEPRHSV